MSIRIRQYVLSYHQRIHLCYFCVLQGSTSTCWLVENHVVVAQGEENRDNFHVLYSMCDKLNSGDVVRLVYDETYTTMTFPPGTKITFPVCVQRDEPKVQGTGMLSLRFSKK